jgi:hypothetical protein
MVLLTDCVSCSTSFTTAFPCSGNIPLLPSCQCGNISVTLYCKEHSTFHFSVFYKIKVLLRPQTYGMSYWLTDYDGVRLCLRTAATNRPIVHPLGDMWAWRAMVMMMLAGDKSWVIHHSSLAVLPAETPAASSRNGWRSENFAYQYLKYLKGSCCKILWHGNSGFISHLKKDVLQIFIAIKIHRFSHVLTCDPWVQWQAH